MMFMPLPTLVSPSQLCTLPATQGSTVPLPPSVQLFYTTLAEIIGSYWLALIFQVSHVISEVDWPQPDKNNFVNQDW